MSTVYLVRHGQAGTRDAYDALSELGKQQSRLLGEYFISSGIRFASAYSGTLRRQQETAEEVRRAFTDASASFPAIQADSGWDEFDLARVYRDIAPGLAADDSEFRREYDEMCAQARASADVPGASVHRKWHPCDTKLVKTWISGRYPYRGESWNQFRERIAACRLKMQDAQRQDNIVVFTSATPVAIWAGLSLEIFDERVMRLAGALYNASYSIVSLREGQLRLLAFNAVPHLATPELCTRR